MNASDCKLCGCIETAHSAEKRRLCLLCRECRGYTPVLLAERPKLEVGDWVMFATQTVEVIWTPETALVLIDREADRPAFRIDEVRKPNGDRWVR